MRRYLISALLTASAIAAGFGLSSCENNGGLTNSSKAISKDIITTVERICGAHADTPKRGVRNIMLMDGRQDDGVVTCNDGTNHYFDG